MKKILIDKRENSLASIVSTIETDVLPEANKLNKMYNDLNIGLMDKEALYDVIFNRCKTTRDKYIQALDDELTKLKIQNPTLKKNMRRGYEESINNLQSFASSLRDIAQYLRMISFQDGVAVLSDTDKARISENIAVYVESEWGIEGYKLQGELANALNKFIKHVKKGNPNIFFINPLQVLNLAVIFDSDKEQFTRSKLGFDAIYKASNA